MKHLFLIILLFTNTILFAQPQSQQNKFERIHAAKVSYITDRLHLTADQSARFWPVYNQYDDALKSLRKEYFDKYTNSKTLPGSEAESRKYVEDDFAFQEAQLALKKKYRDEFQKVLSAQQLAQLYQAERDFKKLLVQELQERQSTGKPGNKR